MRVAAHRAVTRVDMRQLGRRSAGDLSRRQGVTNGVNPLRARPKVSSE